MLFIGVVTLNDRLIEAGITLKRHAKRHAKQHAKQRALVTFPEISPVFVWRKPFNGDGLNDGLWLIE